MMEREFVTSSLHDVNQNRQASVSNGIGIAEGEDSEAEEYDEANPDVGLRPVRTRMTKEKAQEIQKLQQSAMAEEG